LKNVVIVGGGLAGLISGIQLARAGISCTVIEKKSYPLHRVRGEYISNEASHFLKQNHLYPDEFSPPIINQFQLSSVTGEQAIIPLKMGGFGISRFSFDHFLFQQALKEGIQVMVNTEVDGIIFHGGKFTINTQVKDFECDLVIGSFGKRSKLDVFLKRPFIKKRSPFTGIKYHIKTNHLSNRISLHNFQGGYCGVSNVENGITNLCYLTAREQLRNYGTIQELEKEVLCHNPLLREIIIHSEFLFDKPEVINEISFESKAPVENGILMVGDAAGMIAPLCGNGMAMAIHSAKIASELSVLFCRGEIGRDELEKRYSFEWKRKFQNRLWRGRQIQRLFGNKFLSEISVNLLLHSQPLANAIVKSTHGDFF
jgi:menaquinone-9 beta-reductase